MEPQEFAFLGRVSQFLKQRSCLGANISLYCPASEGSQESRQEGGRVAGFFSPPPQRGQEPQNRQVGVRKSSLALGYAEELGEDRKGSQAETCTGLWFKSRMPGNARHTLAGQVLQPVSFMTPDLPSQLSLLLLRGICWMTSFLGQWLRRWGVLEVERGMSC